MKLRFLFHPVSNAIEAARFYREQFGWNELWRESDLTICVDIPGSEVGLVLDQDGYGVTTSGFFEVPSVDEFYNEYKAVVEFIVEPKDIPPGKYAIFQDPDGNPVRIFDTSKDN